MFEGWFDWLGYLDEEVVHNPGTSIFLVAGWIALGLGLKGASNGLFGLVATEASVGGFPIWTKIAIMVLWPFCVYFFMQWRLSH